MVFPEDGITKGEVFDYYMKVAPALLVHVSDRALTVERYPKGIGGQGFMQKNAPDHYPGSIDRHEVPKEDGGTTVYPVVRDLEGIAFFANLGVITFHVPPVTVADTRHPDWVIWDLDPPQGRSDLAREAAVAMRSVLDGHGVATFPMTSGSNGYHLRTRLVPELDWDVVAQTARGAAALAVEEHPDLLTLAFRKKDRGERVFVDWLRNAPYSTAVAPWSLRARDGAPVAAPLHWGEVASIDPTDVRIDDAPARASADPWDGMTALRLGEAAGRVSDAIAAAGIELEPFDRFRS
jgi:bifunctional non-homologous end joining protein LigD